MNGEHGHTVSNGEDETILRGLLLMTFMSQALGASQADLVSK